MSVSFSGLLHAAVLSRTGALSRPLRLCAIKVPVKQAAEKDSTA